MILKSTLEYLLSELLKIYWEKISTRNSNVIGIMKMEGLLQKFEMKMKAVDVLTG